MSKNGENNIKKKILNGGRLRRKKEDLGGISVGPFGEGLGGRNGLSGEAGVGVRVRMLGLIALGRKQRYSVVLCIGGVGCFAFSHGSVSLSEWKEIGTKKCLSEWKADFFQNGHTRGNISFQWEGRVNFFSNSCDSTVYTRTLLSFFWGLKIEYKEQRNKFM